MFRLCPVGPWHVRRDAFLGKTGRRRTGLRSIPAFSRAFDADEELVPTPLRSRATGAYGAGTSSGGTCRRGHVAEYRLLRTIAAAQGRRPLRFEVNVRGAT